MRGVGMFMVLVAIPAFIALGHDIYLFVNNNSMEILPGVLEENGRGVTTFFASLGYIWTTYDPESYKWVAENLEPQEWAIVNEILAQKAVVLGLAFAGFFYVFLGLFRVLRVWPFRSAEGGGRSPRRFAGRGGQPNQLKYKRK